MDDPGMELAPGMPKNTIIFKTCIIETGSFMSGIVSPQYKRLYIHAVWSNQKGDFAKMMDAVIEKYHYRRCTFTNVISKDLVERLHGWHHRVVKWMGEDIINLYCT